MTAEEVLTTREVGIRCAGLAVLPSEKGVSGWDQQKILVYGSTLGWQGTGEESPQEWIQNRCHRIAIELDYLVHANIELLVLLLL